VDTLLCVKGISRGETKESIRLKGKIRAILRGPRPEGLGVCISCGIRAQKESLLSVAEKEEYFSAMPPRRRDRPMPDPAVEREMRELRARLDAMETTQRRTVDTGDISEADSENEAGHGEEVTVEDVVDERLFRVVARIGAREKMEIPMYEGNLDVEELLDWIRALDKYFDYEDVEEDKKVKHVVTRLKGHATLWWDELQADRRCKGKQKIKSWDRMVAKMKAKFIPKDYQITLFRRMQNLRQKLMSVKEYTEEFYKLNIRAGHRESDDEKVARYMNGLRYDIQDEMSMMIIQKCRRCLSDGSES
jgi:hypothetical protein